MSSLTLKNMPDVLLRGLRQAALNDRRSLTQEILHLMDAALRARGVQGASPPAHVKTQLAAWRKLAGKWKSDTDLATETKRLMKRRSSGREVDW